MLSAFFGSIGLMTMASGFAELGTHPAATALLGGLLVGLAPSIRDEAVLPLLDARLARR